MNLVGVLQGTGRMLWYTCGKRTGVKGFLALDGLRGYMAWWVVIGHALQLCGLQNAAPALLMSADHAVNVFVCLSGFVISHLLLERQEPYGAYLRRRAFRIFPIYLFALVCALAMTQMYEFTYLSDWVLPREMRLERLDETRARLGEHLLLHATLLHGMVPDTWLPFSSSSILSPAWSLSLEWQFYLVAPLVVVGLARPGLSRMTTLVLLSSAWLIFKRALPLHWMYPSVLPLSIHFFMLGILSRVFLPAISSAGLWVVPSGWLVAVVAPNSVRMEVLVWSVFLGAACLQLRDSPRSRAHDAFASLIRAITSNALARRLGEFSYSTYLIHVPLFSLLGWTAGKLGGTWTQDDAIASTAVAIVLLVPLSFLLYRFIEQPFIRFGSRWALRAVPVAR
jgi:peptidoglycan/LPS O-acetylase OafA/YrhL